jgi:hypothetical protein
MNRKQKSILREFFNTKPSYERKNNFICNQCEFATWAKTKLVKHKREVHSY